MTPDPPEAPAASPAVPTSGAIVRLGATLLTTSLVGRLPQAMSALAIVRLVVDQGGAYSLAAILTSVYVVASTVGQPVLGRIVDATGRPRLVIVGSAVVAGAALVGLAYSAPGLPIVAVVTAAVSGVATPPIEPTLRSIWPRIMAPGRPLQRAFSADAAVQEIIFITGPLIAALAIVGLGAPATVVLMGALGLIGAAGFSAHRQLAARQVEPRTRGRRGEGRRSPLQFGGVRRLIVMQAAAGLPVGVLTISATAHSEAAGDPALAGWGLAINAGGAFVGALLIARWPFRTPPERVAWRLLVSLGVLYLPTMFVTAPSWFWLAAAVVSGFSLPPLLTQVFVLTERVSPAELLTEANAWVVSAFSIGIAAGTLVTGLAADAGGDAGVAIAVAGASVLTIAGALAARPSGFPAAR